jgi:hypothetical protein
MSEVEERRPDRPAGEFERLAEFAQRGSVLASAQQIRVLGLRRLHRRRACQAVLGTGALAAVVFLTAGFVQNGSSRPIVLGAGAGESGTVATSSPTASKAPSPAASHPVEYMFPSSVTTSSGSAVQAQLKLAGYTSIKIKKIHLDTVPSGNAVDIEDGHGHSLLGRTVAVDTPLTLVVSIGPSAH